MEKVNVSTSILCSAKKQGEYCTRYTAKRANFQDRGLCNGIAIVVSCALNDSFVTCFVIKKKNVKTSSSELVSCSYIWECNWPKPVCVRSLISMGEEMSKFLSLNQNPGVSKFRRIEKIVKLCPLKQIQGTSFEKSGSVVCSKN